MKNEMEGAPISPETMERESRIVLHFLRHGRKGKGDDDYKVRLTPEGRKEAVERANKVNLRQAMAFGSPRERAQESAALIMAGAEDEITGEESFEELKIKINAGINYGEKIFADKNLDFILDEKTPLGAKEMEAYLAKRWMPFLVNESDKLAVELKDKETSTYSSMAADVARVVEKYIKVVEHWHELVNDDKKKYEGMLERFLGSHQGVTESFLSKVIEKIKGLAERNKFVEAVNNQGFDFLEGFDVEIIKKGKDEKPSVRIKYHKTHKDGKEVFSFDEEVPVDVVEEIIREGQR